MPHPVITLEALYVLDAIARRGSFAAAAQELSRAPSSLSYQVQKLEQELDLVIFDRSGHKAKFTQAGELLLERGRHLIDATQSMVEDAAVLAHGWELNLTLAYDDLIAIEHFFPLIETLNKRASTQIKLQQEVLTGGWEALTFGKADVLVSAKVHQIPADMKVETLGYFNSIWVASPKHHVHQRSASGFDGAIQKKYQVVAIADSARQMPPKSFNVLQGQKRLTVTSLDAKIKALRAGLGIGTIPEYIAQVYFASGELQPIHNAAPMPIELVLAWRRNKMGKAKSFCIQTIKKKGFFPFLD